VDELQAYVIHDLEAFEIFAALLVMNADIV